MVQPGLLLSLANTEGVILVESLALVAWVNKTGVRVAFQSLLAGYFAADEANDVVIIVTGNAIVATELALAVAASLPLLAWSILLKEGRIPDSVMG